MDSEAGCGVILRGKESRVPFRTQLGDAEVWGHRHIPRPHAVPPQLIQSTKKLRYAPYVPARCNASIPDWGAISACQLYSWKSRLSSTFCPMGTCGFVLYESKQKTAKRSQWQTVYQGVGLLLYVFHSK